MKKCWNRRNGSWSASKARARIVISYYQSSRLAELYPGWGQVEYRVKGMALQARSCNLSRVARSVPRLGDGEGVSDDESSEAAPLLQELITSGTASTSDQGVVFNRRMVTPWKGCFLAQGRSPHIAAENLKEEHGRNNPDFLD